jgi:hypothetical protein
MPITKKLSSSPESQIILNKLFYMGLATLPLSIGFMLFRGDKSKPVVISELLGFLYNSFGGGMILGVIVGEPLRDIFFLGQFYLPRSLIFDNRISATIQYRKTIANLESKISATNYDSLNGCLSELENIISQGDMSKYYRDRTTAILDAIEYCLVILNAELSPKTLDCSPAVIEDMCNKLDIIRNSFDKATAKQFKNIILKPFLGNLFINKHLPTIPVCIIGPPGIGKTRFVNKLVNAFDVPVLKINLAEGNYIAVSNNFLASGNQHKLEFMHPITRLLHMIAEAGKTGGILFIDEVDKAFGIGTKYVSSAEQLLLQMLNSELRTIEDTHFNMIFAVSKILIVLACNRSLAKINPQFIPIMDRVLEIHCPSLDQQQKTNIINSQAETMFQEADLNITPVDHTKIQYLVKKDRKPGVRQLSLNLAAFVGNRNCDKLFDSIPSWTTKSDDAEIIQTAWRRYRSKKQSQQIATTPVNATRPAFGTMQLLAFGAYCYKKGRESQVESPRPKPFFRLF